jgi:hypothetical protein
MIHLKKRFHFHGKKTLKIPSGGGLPHFFSREISEDFGLREIPWFHPGG